MHNNVQGYRNANMCQQTFDASCTDYLVHFTPWFLASRFCIISVSDFTDVNTVTAASAFLYAAEP